LKKLPSFFNMRTCKKCGAEKPLEAFRPHKTGRGNRHVCRECERAYRAKHYAANPEKYCAISREWCKRNPERRNSTKRNWYRQNKRHHAATVRKRAYGISSEEYNQLTASQDNACAICEKPWSGRVCVDHDHKTGRVRGLLCIKCNAVLGMSNDSFRVLFSAIRYLQKNSS
jgi:hypothetical protein